jgi:hypothetical protein
VVFVVCPSVSKCCLGLASPDFIDNNESKHVRHIHYSADLITRCSRDRRLLEGPRVYWVWEQVQAW